MSKYLSWNKEPYLISTDKSLLQVSRIHSFLSTKAYWCLDIPKSLVEKSISGSLCFGLFDTSKANQQIGYARIVSDGASFAWLCDVYIEEEYRGKGLSKWLMGSVMAHPELKNLRRICLATKDAHELYKKYGFKVTETPQNWMEIKDNDLYKKMKLQETEQ
jgi:GNAT superfamily N-acetyltransferase